MFSERTKTAPAFLKALAAFCIGSMEAAVGVLPEDGQQLLDTHCFDSVQTCVFGGSWEPMSFMQLSGAHKTPLCFESKPEATMTYKEGWQHRVEFHGSVCNLCMCSNSRPIYYDPGTFLETKVSL